MAATGAQAALRSAEKVAAGPEVSETADFVLPIGAGTSPEGGPACPIRGAKRPPALDHRGTSLALNTVLQNSFSDETTRRRHRRGGAAYYIS